MSVTEGCEGELQGRGEIFDKKDEISSCTVTVQ